MKGMKAPLSMAGLAFLWLMLCAPSTGTATAGQRGRQLDDLLNEHQEPARRS